MKPPSYPILDNRPIHQWKVTELKEELKRRRLPLKGLKEDLVRRLDEALRAEMEADSSMQEDVGISQHKVQTEAGKTSTAYTTNVVEPEQVNVAEDIEAHVDSKNFGEVDVDSSVNDAAGNPGAEMLDATHASTLLANNASLTEGGKLSTVSTTDASEPEQVNVEAAKHEEAEVVGDVDCKRSVQIDVDSSVNAVARSSGEKVQEAFNASPLLESDEPVFEAQSTAIISSSENVSSISSLGMQGFDSGQSGKLNLSSRSQPDSEDINLLNEDVKLVLSNMNNQVSEVSPSFGVSVTNNSISTDSVSINEKMNALKDDVLADDVKLESDVKTEMVKPSSSHVVSGGGQSHPMDVEAPHENKISVEHVTNVNVSTKKYSADLDSPEKLNLDRSSGDDSMEEDTLESKLVEERSENTQMSVRKEDNLVDVCDDICTNKDYNVAETNTIVAASAEKRKLPDEQIAGKDEPSKRQRRWKNGSAVDTEPQNSTLLMATIPRATPDATGLKCSFSRNNSYVSEEIPKERVVPPASKLPTDSLRIDNFLRPFTLKAVQELLGKTGTVSNFWMDQIKTHCYVTYSSVEEAIETRNAVYNLQWPPNGGKLLTAEFVDAQEVKSRLEGPPPTHPPVTPVSIGAPSGQALPSPRELLGLKQKHLPPQQHILPPPPSLNSNVPPPERERVRVAPPPPLPEKVEPPIVTLDDLFRKTKATPRIYYLPLSEEQVKAKLQARRQ